MILDQERAATAAWMMRTVKAGRYHGAIARMLEAENGGPHVPQRALYRGAAHVDVDLPDQRGVRLLLSHDVGHHTSGWFKNPDYEQCLHLSISYRYPFINQALPQDHKDAAEWVKAFFGEARRYVWTESPKSTEGRQDDVWHYRMFCDDHFAPILPRGEVYSRELTGAGFASYSDVAAEIADEPHSAA